MRLRSALPWARLGSAWLTTFIFCVPIYLVLVNAFKTTQQIFANPLAPPVPGTLDNLVKALSRPDHLVQGGVANSILLTGATLALLIPLASIISLWISGLPKKIQGILLLVFSIGLMIPPQVGLQPTVQVLRAIGLMNTYPGLILVNIGGGYLAFAVFVYVGFLRAVPRDVLEAARVDGAGEWRVWWSIVMPLIRPATVTVGIFIGLWTWNDFLSPLIILGPLQGQTITVAMYLAMGVTGSLGDYGQLFGIMLLSAIIPIIGYLCSQREFIAGLTQGAAKG